MASVIAGASRNLGRRNEVSKPEITIEVRRGSIDRIDWPAELNNLFRVVVMDYDTDGADLDEPDVKQDADGEFYFESAWEDPEPEAPRDVWED